MDRGLHADTWQLAPASSEACVVGAFVIHLFRPSGDSSRLRCTTQTTDVCFSLASGGQKTHLFRLTPGSWNMAPETVTVSLTLSFTPLK